MSSSARAVRRGNPPGMRLLTKWMTCSLIGGLPVVDGVAAAVKLAEALVGLGLTTSKRGPYAPPLPKPFTGAFAGLSRAS